MEYGIHNKTDETLVYDLAALSKKLNLGIVPLRKYIASGMLRARKIGRKFYVTESNLLAFLDPDNDQEVSR
jgi:hypothetical protein